MGFIVNIMISSGTDSSEVCDLNKHVVRFLSAWDHFGSYMPNIKCLHILTICDYEDP